MIPVERLALRHRVKSKKGSGAAPAAWTMPGMIRQTKPKTVGLWTWFFEHFTIQKNWTEKIKVHRHEEPLYINLYNPIQSYTYIFHFVVWFNHIQSIHYLRVYTHMHPMTPCIAPIPGERSSMASALVSIQPRRRPGMSSVGPARTPGPGFMVDICRYIMIHPTSMN
jgi:hypothetical protein